VLFNAGCNEEVFSSKFEKTFGADPSSRFEKNAKNAPLIPKNDVTEPKARLL